MREIQEDSENKEDNITMLLLRASASCQPLFVRHVDDVAVCRGGDRTIRFVRCGDSHSMHATAGVEIVIISPRFVLIVKEELSDFAPTLSVLNADPRTWGALAARAALQQLL